MSRKLLRSVLLLLVCAAAAWGQDFRGTITGQVTDPSGAAVPDATIKATRAGTNEVVETKTNATGVYNLSYLNPGTFTIEVSATGFQSHRREGIVLAVADRLNLPITLAVGQVAESITVVGEQELIRPPLLHADWCSIPSRSPNTRSTAARATC